VIIQYGCEDTLNHLRDGYPSDDSPLTASDNNNAGYFKATFTDNSADGTDRIPCPSTVTGCQGNFGDSLDTNAAQYLAFYHGENVQDDASATRYGSEYGYHENFEYYRDQCLWTERNGGLYTADQSLNGHRAMYTRQNPNGDRHGFECPEERDYYPWWQSSPWIDVAILVSDTSWCDYYQNASQNVLGRYYCQITDGQRAATTNQVTPITQSGCFSAGGSWKYNQSHAATLDRSITKPDCLLHPYSRDNHLGNVITAASNGKVAAEIPVTAHYDWTIPKHAEGQKCVLRIRYNISSSDYPSMNFATLGTVEGSFWDSRYNCDPDTTGTTTGTGDNLQCTGILTDATKPLYDRPFVGVFTGYPKLGIAFNSDQVGRTFQDRSYVLRVKDRPTNISDSAAIYNLGYRGRRGNIVQCYPAVEYDFVPTNLTVDTNSYVHIQFCGSDFNAAKNPNDAEGWQYSDRTNMVQVTELQTNFPMPGSSMTMWTGATWMGNTMNATVMAITAAYVGISEADLMDSTKCHTFPNNVDNDEDNSVFNCGKLNRAPARFDMGLVKFTEGVYQYFSSRNNDFSNRSQKATLKVKHSLSVGARVAIATSSIIVAGAVLGGAFVYAKKRPESRLARMFRKSKGTSLV